MNSAGSRSTDLACIPRQGHGGASKKYRQTADVWVHSAGRSCKHAVMSRCIPGPS